jgi:glycolate oxidase FAD binding subunit
VIIGITVAYADGTVGKAGGLVVKNVSGFDMMRIHYGALGTLGVITSANFKVLPIPRSEFTVIHAFPTLGAAADVLSRLRPPSLRPVALTLALENEQWSLAARFEGRGSGLGALMSAISEFLDTSTRFEDRDSAAWWQKLVDGRAFGDENEVRLQLRTQPTDIVPQTAKALDCISRSGAQLTRTEIEPGLGVATISWTDSEGATEATIHSLRQALPTTSVTIMTAPDRVKATQDVWGQEPESIELMRRLKREFDPHCVLNPGRFAGMI